MILCFRILVTLHVLVMLGCASKAITREHAQRLAEPVTCINQDRVLAFLRHFGFRSQVLKGDFSMNRNADMVYFYEFLDNGGEGDVYAISRRGVSVIPAAQARHPKFDDSGRVIASKVEGRWKLISGQFIDVPWAVFDDSGSYIVYSDRELTKLTVSTVAAPDVIQASIDVDGFAAEAAALRDNQLLIFGHGGPRNPQRYHLLVLSKSDRTWSVSLKQELPPGRFKNISPSGRYITLSKETWPLIWQNFVFDRATNDIHAIEDRGCVRFIGQVDWLNQLVDEFASGDVKRGRS